MKSTAVQDPSWHFLAVPATSLLPDILPRLEIKMLNSCTLYSVVQSLSCVFTTRWTWPPASSVLGISRQECWSGLPFPSPGDLPRPGTEPASPVLAGGFFTTEPLGSLTPCMLYSGVQKSTATHVLRRMYTSDNVRQTHELTYLTGHESTCPHLPKFES